MKTFYARSQEEVKGFDTSKLRENFLIEDLFVSDELKVNYLHYDRVVVFGAKPVNKTLDVKIDSQIGAAFFLQRRECGIINIGGEGIIEYDGNSETLKNKDGLYLPVGTEKISVKSVDPSNPALFYGFSTQGLIKYPVTKVDIANARAINLGSDAESNKRVIYQFFHPNVCQTNSLLMGMTLLEPNNMWNTMPCHTHERRTECYLYFDLEEEQRVFHMMGQPQETRHLVVKNNDFVISAPWSIHSGVGTRNYSFIWAMGGENLDYTDMQGVATKDLK
ncbi:5-dehydro-4-deoxy-D-glucuronate isomerase [Mycoplasmopsis gallinacea]|uniref:4-deoxy-L-threo-5-hexosulose-uronate ketol-isomerase n=1 Tax=Mycoplasmopsis gallinacea TaxID=29556 RepID=A0A6H0V6F4_9BACT|nr:5-dehydro-4-deoxy-D-glucuronate isomerase [Mycoplasmopsis gallinacea]QIW62617.1 5-dehydro-4-deoxy-D-glucuronate isomerase [Mycoplasmopsis gallinacea]